MASTKPPYVTSTSIVSKNLNQHCHNLIVVHDYKAFTSSTMASSFNDGKFGRDIISDREVSVTKFTTFPSENIFPL